MAITSSCIRASSNLPCDQSLPCEWIRIPCAISPSHILRDLSVTHLIELESSLDLSLPHSSEFKSPVQYLFSFSRANLNISLRQSSEFKYSARSLPPAFDGIQMLTGNHKALLSIECKSPYDLSLLHSIKFKLFLTITSSHIRAIRISRAISHSRFRANSNLFRPISPSRNRANSNHHKLSNSNELESPGRSLPSAFEQF